MNGSGSLDLVSPEDRSVLSLARLEGRSYEEIGSVLDLSPDEVRDRAHRAGTALVGDRADRPPAEVRERIVDLLLGQQTASARAHTRALLDGSRLAREWAEVLEDALGQEGEELRPEEAVHAPEPAPVVLPERGPAPPRKRARSKRRAVGVAAVAGALIVAALVVVLVVGSGGSTRRALGRATSVGRSASRAPVTRTRLVLNATGAQHGAAGAGALVRQGSTTLLLIQGRGLKPNRHNAYAVWLYNTPVDSRLLGFISPAVGQAGTFSSGTQLPNDAVRFGQLLITLESAPRPTHPGEVVLRAPLLLG